MKTISMKQLKAYADQLKSDELILDVRTPEEYKEGHIPRSRNIPHEQVEKFASELKKYKRIYVHCRSGGRAKIATEALTQAGLSDLICISSSGMPDWISEGFPVEKP
jgi:rhodanese-related sulfurtransferase